MNKASFTRQQCRHWSDTDAGILVTSSPYRPSVAGEGSFPVSRSCMDDADGEDTVAAYAGSDTGILAWFQAKMATFADAGK